MVRAEPAAGARPAARPVPLIATCPAAPPPPQAEPERLRRELGAHLDSLGVPYGESQTSKFANFVNKTLL